MKETELYMPIKEYFEDLGYQVNAEVHNCDIALLKDDKLIIIELKTSMSVRLLAQANIRQKAADYVYVAIPRPTNFRLKGKWKDILSLLKRLNIGLIFIDFRTKKKKVEIIYSPDYEAKSYGIRRQAKVRERIVKETEERTFDKNIGGSTQSKIMTSYREKALYIAYCLERFGDLSNSQLKKLGADEKKSYSILYQNYYGWFDRVEKGVYGLNELGKVELSQLDCDYKEMFEEKLNQYLEEEENS